MGTYILEVRRLDLRVDVEPFKNLVTGHTLTVRHRQALIEKSFS